jgi:hypothetical protein
MRRRSKESTNPPLILSLFLVLPWYVGPITAGIAYAVLRWVIPYLLPLPNSELKSAGDGIALMFASFAQAGPKVAPIAVAVILFAWVVAELMKLAQRIGVGGVTWSGFRKHSPVEDTAMTPASAISSLSAPQKRHTASNPNSRKGNSSDSDPRRPPTVINQSRQTVANATTLQSPAVDREIDVSKMSWKEFEKLLVQVLRRFGFQAEHTGRNGPDGGIDVRCTDSKGQTILVQCKHWHNQEVGVTVIREFFGVLIHEGAARGLVVSSGLFTQEARKFAESKPLTLVDGEKLLKVLAELPDGQDGKKIQYRISRLETVISSERCPRCQSRMIRKKGRRGAFLGCERYPDCEGTREV